MAHCKAKTVLEDPHLMEKWNHQLNHEKLKKLSRYSHAPVLLNCPLNHTYSIKLNTVKCHIKNQCPYCNNRLLLTGFNDFKTIMPTQLKYWDYKKNNKPPEETIYKGSSKIHLKCPQCKYEWSAAATKRTANKGCPICNGALYAQGFNDFKTIKPELLEEWDNELNNKENIFINKLKNNKTKVWWKCRKCSKNWRTAINKRISGGGCPNCSMHLKTSKGEKELLQYVRTIYTGTIMENNREILEGLEADIYLPNKNIIIEYNGDYWHSIKSRHYNNEEEVHNYHMKKYKISEDKSIQLVFVWESQWRGDKENIKKALHEIINNGIVNEILLKTTIEELP